MAEVGGGAVRLIDKDGDPLDDGEGRLNINATLEAASVNVGDVDIVSVPAPLNRTGGGIEATALRVTIANDSTGVLSVDDNGSTLSVDDGGGSITVDNTYLSTYLSTINNNGATLLTLFKAEDSVHSTGDYGLMSLAVRNDSIQALGGADGDYAPLQVSAKGALYVEQLVHGSLDTVAMLDIDNSAQQLSGTAVGTVVDCAEIFLQADESNSGYVIVGDSDIADNRGMKLNPGDSIILDIHDTRVVYLWGSADNQNVRCMLSIRDT